MATYPTLKVVKTLLQRHGLAPRKRLGQNFLVEANIARKSLQLADIQQDDTIVEIGPGLGALTQLLLEAGCQVFAIEMDAGLHRYLDSVLASQSPDSFHLMQGDAMDHPLASLTTHGGTFKIVANLPYAISTPWLDAVLSGPLPSRMVLMLQKEAADRFVAKPGTGTFGPISLFLKCAYEVDAKHSVSAQCFYPTPDVGSALLSLKRKSVPILFSPEIKDGIRQIFRQRRKQISSILAKIEVVPEFESWLKDLINSGFSPETRPEAITVKEWEKLAGP
ncbi:MAG: 16S rRNA (adenine(1518)-N(6)/adenine(1519)-N(6))-dimethyltransferase RsmA [Verrucomicrobia bacterium]|nr:16S rRNA (adenine(1518)-N(6)/adenine(1519)-N(6))-dimethyltransferase RsmA [Verrucomicrobiota bacterium]